MSVNGQKILEIIIVSNQALDLSKLHSDQHVIEHRLVNNARKEFLSQLVREPFKDLKTSTDIIIRLNGSKSLSDSVITEACYAELFFVDHNELSFDLSDLQKIIEEFYSRKRNFGS
jgi:undecaprenyl diphosphate synthase